ncbi:MAG: AAA family ATPase [Planctomycetes bacterium]|nr:AAA family ATPase [Planctomycetota bacterium]
MSPLEASSAPLLAHWNLKRHAFQDTPDPSFFFPGGPYRETQERLRYALLGSDAPFAVLIGPMGSGKTLLSEVLAGEIEKRELPAVLVRCVTGRPGDIWSQIGMETGRDMSPPHGVSPGRHASLELARAGETLGKTHRILVDNAQQMPQDDFEELQWLSEGPGGAGVRTLLAGTEELADRVGRVPAIRDRALIWTTLRGLTPAETSDYLAHRLRAAGHAGGEIFDPAAVRVVHHFARGLPRTVNRFCHLALEVGALTGARRIGVEEIRRVVLDYYTQRVRVAPLLALAESDRGA